MNTRIYYPTLIFIINETLRNSFWYKKDLRSFLLAADVPPTSLNNLSKFSKKDTVRALLGALAKELSVGDSVGETILEKIATSLVNENPEFPRLGSRQDQREYVQHCLGQLKEILEAASPARAPLQTALFAEVPSESLATVAGDSTAEQIALRGADYRCQLCYAPPSKAPLTIHRPPNSLPDSQERLTILCGGCNKSYSELRGLLLLEIASIATEYDFADFDILDSGTWPMLMKSTVDISLAEEVGLDPWSHYCPECGSIALDYETLAPYVICRYCAKNSSSSELDPESVSLDEFVKSGKPKWKTHREYLLTAQWRKFADEIKNRDKQCIMCSRADNLVAHHRTYTRYKVEKHEDVVTLCQPCHDLFHFARDLYESPTAIRAKRKEFRTALYSIRGKTLQTGKIDESLAELVERHLTLKPITFGWSTRTDTIPRGRQFSLRNVRMSGDFDILRAVVDRKEYFQGPDGDSFEVKGSTLIVKFFFKSDTPQSSRWNQIKAHWKDVAAQALRLAQSEVDSEINLARQHLYKVAQDFHDKQRPLP